MKVVVTGAAGFLGSHLVDRCLKSGYEVVGIDNLSTGDERNLRRALADPGFSLLRADATEDACWSDNRLAGASLILHFASPASPIDYAQLPLQTMAVNSRGTEQGCKAALRCNAALLYASTSETYGDPLEHPQRESYWGNVNPVGPRSCYDESKRFGEALVMSYVRAHGLNGRLIRIFNTYGPRMRRNDGRVVPNFICQALANEPMTIYGEGSQTRSFCFVDDLIEGVLRAATTDAARGVVINLGNPQEYTIAQFARKVCEAVGVSPNFVSRPMPKNDPSRRCPDITRAKKLLDWEPKTVLEEGLRKTIDYFKSTPQ